MTYKVKDEFKPLCCPNVQKVGDILEILKQTSKNRLTIQNKTAHNGCHNVKRSTFFRCCEEIK